MALGSTQPLKEGVFPGGKGGRCVRLTTYHHSVPLSRNLGTLTSWNPLGLSRPAKGLLYLCFTSKCLLEKSSVCMLQVSKYYLTSGERETIL